ncbi:hypothetical protein AeNC1_003731 [Aphanomyces euteiches]|nr:hypothetical protein AeNC1_003731 [Aphanomyces euteiches]
MVKVVVALGAMLATANAGTITEYPESVLKKIDTTVDPCQDFYEYACGSWYKSHGDVDTFIDMTTSIGSDAATIIDKAMESNEPRVAAFYKSCMDTDKIEKLGVSPLSKPLAAIREAKSKLELAQVAAGLMKQGVSAFTMLYVKGDDRDATMNTLFALQSPLPLTSKERYLDENFWSTIEADYKMYISTLFKLVGRSPEEASDAAMKTIGFEKTLTRSMLSTLESLLVQASREDYFPFSLFDAATRFPLSVGPLLDTFGLNTTGTEPITPGNRIVFYDLSYFDKIEALLHATSLDDLKTVIEYRLLQVSAPYLSSHFEKAHWAFFEQKLKGKTSPPSRASKCTEDAGGQATKESPGGLLNDLLGAYYLKERWSTERADKSMEYVQELTASAERADKSMEYVQELTASAKASIQNADWVDEWTRTNALNKLAKIDFQLGGPGMPQLYPNLQLDGDSYFENRLRITKASTEEMIERIGTPVNKKIWHATGISAQSVNAHYVPSMNRIAVAAAMLQPPFFDLQADPAQNFGGAGHVVGHEIFHGFDNFGRNYDPVGNLAPWWSNASDAAFVKKAQCLVDQYGNFTARSETTGKVIGNLNGQLTLGENIGDNSGLKASFRAYQGYVKTHESKYTKETGEKLFFLSFAQSWCGKYSDYGLQYFLTDPHPPNRFRIFGILQNNFDFARVFNCPADTFMNPSQKCTLWE